MATAASRIEVIKSHIAQSDAALRPILTYANGDVAWLISFPRPAPDRSAGRKAYYHAIVDPWFGAPSRFMTSFMLELKLGRDPALPSRAAVDAAIVEIELAAGNSLVPTDAEPAVDGIFVAGMAEHCNKESLLEFSPSTPVFAVAAAAGAIAPWGHFTTVVTMHACDPSTTSWREGHPGLPLPEWLTVFPPAVTRSNNFGLMFITTAIDPEGEMILLAPHGMSADEASIKGFPATVKMLALVGPLKDSYLFGIQTVLGVGDGLAITHAAGARYYVRSGDFVSLRYKGLIGRNVRDEPRDLQWGVDKLRGELGSEKVIQQPTMVEVGNGDSYVLA